MRWSYKYYPYSKQLVDLALKCTQVDLNQRVPVQQLYEITKVAASKAFLPVWESANTREHTHATYNGLVLYSKALQSRFEQSNVFRENHRDWSDWFTVHEERHRKLADYSRRIIDYKWYRGKLKHLPKKGQVGIGNGLRRPMREAKLRAMNPHRQTAEWRKEGLFYTADGKASEHGEDPIYWYKGDDIIRPPHQWA